MMKAAVYARVSDDKLTEQGERFQDVQRQVEKLKAYALAFKYEPDQVMVFIDDGLSAFKDDYQSRPAFVKMLREIKGRHINRVFVENLDRWSRRLEDGLKTLKDASEADCTITSIHEGEIEITSSMGWFRASLALMMAEWSSRVSSERIRGAMLRRRGNKENACVSCGVVHMGRHPLQCQCKPCLKRGGQNPKSKTPEIEGGAGVHPKNASVQEIQ